MLLPRHPLTQQNQAETWLEVNISHPLPCQRTASSAPQVLSHRWMIGWTLMILTHLLFEGRVAEEVSVAELCLNVSGKLFAGTVIV